MSLYNEAIKLVLSDVSTFLASTLKPEKLSQNGLKEKAKLLDSLQKLFTDYPSLVNQGDNISITSSTAVADESRNTASSHGSEEDYSDNIPETTVKSLNDAQKMGYLDRRQKGLLSTWQKQYCVLHKCVLYCFKKPADKKQKGAFFVTGYEVVSAPQNVKDTAKKEASFELVSPGKKTYQFCADNQEDFESWRDAINSFCVESAGLTAEEFTEDDVYEPLDEDVLKQAQASQFPQSPKSPITSASSPPDNSQQSFNRHNDEELAEDMDDIYEPLEVEPRPPSRSLPSPSHETRSPTSPRPALPSPPSTADAPPALPRRNVPLPPAPQIPLPKLPEEKKKRKLTLSPLFHHPSEDFENMFYGVWPSKAASENELSFERGDIIHIINRELERENWWIGELKGKIGLVPKTFMHPAYLAVS